MEKLKVLYPAKNVSWLADVIFLVVPILVLLPGAYNAFINPRPEGHESDGTVWIDGSLDGLSGLVGALLDIVSWVFLLFLLSIPLVAAIRIFHRIKGRYLN